MMSVRALVFAAAIGVIPAGTAAKEMKTSVPADETEAVRPPTDAADRLLVNLEDPRLRELVRDTLERNPTLATAIATARASLHEAPQVQALPDPMVGVTAYVSSPETRVGPQRLMATLSQRLPWFGKRSLRERAALHQSEALVSAVAAHRLDLVTEVRRLAYEIAFLDGYRKVVETDRETLIHYEELARARYASGVGVEQGVIKIQAEITKDDNRLLDIATRRATLVATLNALRDRPQESPIPKIVLPADTTSAPPLEALRARALEMRPELDAAEASVARADTLVELARSEYKPDITVGATYGLLTGRTDLGAGLMPPADNGKDVFGISLSLNLPIKRGKLDAGLEEATGHRLAAVERKRDVTTLIDRALGELFERLRLTGEQVRLFERVLIIQAEQSLQSAESGYAAGTLNSLDLLDAERVLLEVRTGTERARADHAVALARLEGAIGGPLTETNEGAQP
jgi:outer membrane protein TolC